MRVRQHVAHQARGLAGVDEIVDDQEALAGAAAELCGLGRDALQDLQSALPVVIVARDADGIDHAHAEFAGDDRRRHQPAAGDRDHGVERADLVQPPGQRPAIPVKLVPRDRKRLARPLLRAEFGMLRHHHAPVSCRIAAAAIVPSGCPTARSASGPRSAPPAFPSPHSSRPRVFRDRASARRGWCSASCPRR